MHGPDFYVDGATRLAESLLDESPLIEGRRQSSGYIDAFIASRAQLRFIEAAVDDALRVQNTPETPQFTVCVFGSHGRFDSHPVLSDVDVMVVFDPANNRSINENKASLLQTLATRNRTFVMDHREEIELADLSNFDHNTPYPFIDRHTVIANSNDTGRARRLQLLTEARPVIGSRYFNALIADVMASYELDRLPARAFPSRTFVQDVRWFHANFWKSIVDRAREKTPLINGSSALFLRPELRPESRILDVA